MDRRNKKGSIALANQSEALDKAAKTFMGFPILTRAEREHEEVLDMVSSSREVLGDDHPLTVIPLHLGDDRTTKIEPIILSPLDEISDGPFGTLDDEEAGVFEQVPDPLHEIVMLEYSKQEFPIRPDPEEPPKEEEIECSECDGYGSCGVCSGGCDCQECDEENEEEASQCPYCEGSGSCWKCNGSGDCDECEGLGTLPKGGK